MVILLIGGLESIPGFPGHDQAALLGELVASNGTAATAKINPFSGGHPPRTCADVESTYGVGNHLFKNTNLGFYASIWPSYGALQALYVQSLFPARSGCFGDFQQNIRAIDDNYWDDSLTGAPAAYDQGPRAFHASSDLPRVDDSLWMGLTVMQDYVRTTDPVLLRRAEAVFHLAVLNWDPHGGGIFWELHTSSSRDLDRAVVSNAPALVLGVELYLQTHRHSYLTWSEKIFGWLNAELLDRASGLYNDHVDDRRGRRAVDSVKYTYNQGMMVAAMAALSRVDPTRYPLADAVRLAQRSMAYFAAHRSYGRVPSFDMVWAQAVLWTASLSADPAFVTQARDSVEAAVHAQPKPHDLLSATSEITLQDLLVLAPSEYGKLLFATPNAR